ncbi:insulinase family protein [Marinomonas sp. 15G1-11]|uniref:Protease 3 n=1 Tax=Marinomonas phaeophyticola TaxID=3004091 RepID=A0ABT4JYQ5_9GAMM|nr:insulinase family protein [Marinomonas sp. 15G1-11]MCZ2723360.1 insulinase family protein [Marinomonas sp. 15G1-11]
MKIPYLDTPIILALLAFVFIHPNSATANSTSSETLNQMTTINKSNNDQNTYKSLQLENGLRVLLVSDPIAEKSSASLSVNVGSYQDPKQQEGLAHFLEHMLFLGTEKYPDASAYQAFITENGGANNAYTSSNTTNYYFDIREESYPEALDRFSQFFISPLFSKEFTDREKNAVHSEYLSKINDDSRRANQAFKTLLNPEHPQSRFSVGNLETLKDRPNLDLQAQLRLLFDTYYKANNMALTLISKLPIERLEALTNTYFQNIKGQPTKIIDTTPQQPLTLNNTPSVQFIEPIADIQKIQFYFPIPTQQEKYKSKPAQYLTYILGHEGAGSLLSYLKQQDWANALGASTGTPFGKEQLFSLSIRLTDSGLEHIDEVVKAVAHAIRVLKNSPIEPLYLEESQTLSRLGFEYYDYIHPIRLSSILSSRVLRYPAEDILSSFKISETAAVQDIESLMPYLNVDNMLVQLISKKGFPNSWSDKETSWNTETWYKSKYANLTPNQHLRQLFLDPYEIGQISLPEANPFLPDNLDTINEFDEHPRLIFQRPGLVYWHRSDNRFDKPASNHFLSIRFANAADTAQHYLLNRLLTRLFDEAMSEQTYLPYVAGLGYRIYPHLNGVTINTSGYSDKQFDYLKQLLNDFLTFKPSEDRFEENKKQLLKDLSNQINTPPYQLAISQLSDLITEESIPNSKMIEVLPSLTFDDLIGFMKPRLNSFNLVAFSNGNVTHAQSQQFANTLLSTTKPYLNNQTGVENDAVTLAVTDRLTHEFTANSKDQSVLYVIREQTGLTLDNELKSKMYFAILNQLFATEFYSSLRTRQQFGYIVSTHNFVMQNIPSLAFTVQSPNRSNTEIVTAIERFITNQHSRIEELSRYRFDKAKTTIMQSLLREPKSLKETTGRDWREIAKLAPDFKRKERLIETLDAISMEEFIHFYQDKIRNGNATRLLIHNHPLTLDNIDGGKWLKI